MSPKNRWSTRPWIAAIILVMVAGITVLISGQQRGRMAGPQSSMHVPILSRGPQGEIGLRGIVEDWSSGHLVFSNPGTEDDAIWDGRHEEWVRIVNNPRYIMQQLKRRSPAQGPAAEYVDRMNALALSQQRAAGVSPEARQAQDAVRVVKGGKPVKHRSLISRDWNVSLGATTAQSYLSYPAKWSFSTTTASCAGDYVVYPTGGSTTQASIIAYYNLYSGCGGTVPQVDWAYKTGGAVTLAPVLYFGGSQLAVIQSSGGVASLVLVRYPNTPPGTGTLASPATPASQTASNYYAGGSGCTAPCMTSITLNGSPDDLTSSPYYDFGTDSLYVGDNAGKLHKFNPVFKGIPAEVTANSWPLLLNSSNDVSSPVYDATSACVFVGDLGGIFYSVTSGNSGSVCTSTTASKRGTSSQLDVTFGIRDAPLVDSTAARLYVFSGNNSAGNNGVYQFATNFTSGTGTEVNVGSGGTGTTAYQLAGTFDNTYYTSSNGSSPSGNIYVCSSAAAAPLYKVPISGNTMGTPVAGPDLSTASFYGRCSPVSEFFNTSLPSAATGTVTIQTDPNGWGTSGSRSVTIGSTTYTFVTSSSPGTNQVHLNSTGFSSGTRETRTAQNLRAAINANSSQCFDSGCFGGSTVANASVTATFSSNVVTLTSKTSGSAGDFTMSTNYTTGIGLSGGDNGSDGVDYIFLSVYVGSQSGCTASANNGCVMSFDVTTPSDFSGSLTALGTLNTAAVTNASPTGGIIVDNALTSPTGTSQIYFQVADTASPSAPCTAAGGNCAVQAAQAAP